MPRYFFDISDGGLTVDDEGIEFPNNHAASDAAVNTLPDIARDKMKDGQSRDVLVLVRNEEGRAIFTASLTLAAKWLIETP